jgi:YggT family protein
MVLFANFLIAVSKMLSFALQILMLIVIFRAVLSWFNIPSLYQVKVIIYRLTEPVLKPLRRIIPPHKMGGIDLTPLIVIFVIYFVDSVFVRSLYYYARQLLK